MTRTSRMRSHTRIHADGIGPLARVPARRGAGGDRLRPHDGPGRSAPVGSGRRRGDAARDGHRAHRRHHRHRRGRARRGADAVHRREGRAWPSTATATRAGPSTGSTSPSIRSKAPTCAPLAPPMPLRCWPRPSKAGCCTRPTSTWRSSSSGPAPSTSSISTRRCARTCAPSPAALGRQVDELAVVVLDRPRHEKLIARHPRHRRPHPPDRRRRSVGRHRRRRRRQRRPRRDGYRRRARKAC